jgi:signal transduction histidine kinase
MSLSEKLKFFKTIRFKLTLLYSLIFFMFSSLLVLSFNVYFNNYLQSDPDLQRSPQRLTINMPNGKMVINNFQQLQQEERDRIQEIRNQDLKEIQTISFIALFPMALLSFLVGYWTSGSFLNPIGKLGVQFENLTRKDLGKTIPVEVEDEVGDLITSFNKLSLRLKNSFDTQEQFVQDASHELKTPLTVIQTNLDTVADDPTATIDDLREGMRNALLGMKNLRKLSENLLQLSEAENLTKEEIELNQLLQEQSSMLKDYAQNRQVKLSETLPDKVVKISGNKLALGRAVFNILENAIKYSADTKDSKVEIILANNKDNALITISDNGPGIPVEFQKQIFKRFYRVDKSRARASGGFGLGLAIAKKIISAHSGEISLVSSPGSTKFIITLPLLKK